MWMTAIRCHPVPGKHKQWQPIQTQRILILVILHDCFAFGLTLAATFSFCFFETAAVCTMNQNLAICSHIIVFHELTNDK